MHLAASHRRLSLVIALLLCVVGSVCSLSAQTTNAKIIGVVTDPSGAVVPGAKVTVRNTLTNVATTVSTNKSGGYEALSLPIGQYSVEVEKSGFATTTSPAYALQINQTQKVDFKLPLAGETQAIEVTIQAAAIDTVSSTVGGSVTERPLVDLPLNGRDILDLAQLQPGVTTTNPDNTGAGNVSIAGGRTDSVTYLLDGGNNTSLLNNGVVFNPNPDAVEEFRILENNYSAEYGRNGGGVISVVSKSGTRAYHGTVFEFARNDSFNANSFFNKRNDLPRDDLKRHQFGGTFGGEFFIPKVLPRKDKFFYFFSYQGQRQIAAVNNGQVQVATTAEVLNGDFSGAGQTTQTAVAEFLQANPFFQPNTSLAAQGIFDPTTFDPVAKAYIKAGIFAYGTTGLANATATSKNNFDQYNGKFDFVLSPKDHMAISLAKNKNPSTSPFASGATTQFPVQNETDAYVVNIDETHAFTARLLNDARFVAQRLRTVQDVPLLNLPTPGQLGIGVTPDVSTGPSLLYFYDTGDQFGFSPNGPTQLNNNTFAYTDDLSWVHGHHNLKFGASFAPYQNNTLYDFYVDGNFFFYGLTDNNPDDAGFGNVGTGTGFAEFLAGIPDEYLQYGSAPSNIRSKASAFYAQDEWHALPNLTLNYGIRYEYSTPKMDTQGRSFSLVSGAQSSRFTGAPEGLLFPGDKGAPNGANFPVKDNFAPRFGFAYDIGGRGKTVVRGGTGVFFDILKGEDNLQFNGQAPFYGYEDIFFTQPVGATGPLNNYEDPFAATGTVNTFPSKPPTKNLDFSAAGFLPFGGGGVFFVDPHLRTPYTMQFNLGVQHEIGGGVVAEVTYVGSVSRKYTALADSNPFILGTQNRLYDQANGGNGNYRYLDTFRNLTSANYNSLQTSLRKQTSHTRFLGTTYFQLSYTYAKNMDNVSGFRQRNSEVPYYNPGLFYGPSDSNVPQRLVFSGGWDLPFDDFFPKAPKAITKGWSLYPIASKQHGFPLDVSANLQRDSSDPGPTGAGDQELIHANLVGSKVHTFNPYSSVAGDGSGAPYFSSSNFDGNVTSGYGTLRRNSFYGPGFSNVDMSIVKATDLTRGDHPLNFEFRADMFNMLNFTEFANPNTTISSSQFGEITTTLDQSYRIIQLAGKLRF